MPQLAQQQGKPQPAQQHEERQPSLEVASSADLLAACFSRLPLAERCP